MAKKSILGTSFKERRLALGLTKLEVAQASGFENAKIINRWERGELPAVDKREIAPEAYQISKKEWLSILQEELGLPFAKKSEVWGSSIKKSLKNGKDND
jgi:transcriptional regulator with XRE-family HTH domain